MRRRKRKEKERERRRGAKKKKKISVVYKGTGACFFSYAPFRSDDGEWVPVAGIISLCRTRRVE